jgi:hypothetical protein
MSREYLQADLVQQERRPHWFEENCRLQGCRAQSPSRGLWRAGGLDDLPSAGSLLELQVLVLRRCRCLAQH